MPSVVLGVPHCHYCLVLSTCLYMFYMFSPSCVDRCVPKASWYVYLREVLYAERVLNLNLNTRIQVHRTEKFLALPYIIGIVVFCG